MRNNKSFMRIVVAIAICLAGMTTFSGCKKNDFTVPPSRVENFTATTGDGMVCLKWNAPLNTNGKITGYEITMDNWTNKVSKNANQFSHTYSNLTNNTEYRFKVRALNVNGAGTESILTAKPSEFDGIFVGTYTLTNLHHGFSWNYTPTIEFENGNFKYNNGFTGLCCCGKGKFTITGDIIFFEEEINNNGPTPSIDCGDTFDSKYKYIFEGDSLFLSNTNSMFSGEFKLKKETGK